MSGWESRNQGRRRVRLAGAAEALRESEETARLRLPAAGGGASASSPWAGRRSTSSSARRPA